MTYQDDQIEKKFQDIESEVQKSELQPIWYSELKEMDIPPPSWRIDRIVSKEGITVLSSLPGKHKTWIALDMAVKVSLGEPLFGQFKTEQCGVLILDEESGLGRIRDRLAKLGDSDMPIATLSYNHKEISKSYAQSVIKYCQANSIGLVIFDSLTRFHNANENSSQEMSKVLSYFQLIAQAGLAVLIIHHDRKPGLQKGGTANDLRGSVDISAVCDVLNSLSHTSADSSDEIVFKQNKCRDGLLLPEFKIAVKTNEDSSKICFDYTGEAPKRKSKDELTDEAIIAYISEHGYSSQEDIVIELSGIAGQTKVADRLDVLAADHRLDPFKAAHGKKYFDLPKEQDHE